MERKLTRIREHIYHVVAGTKVPGPPPGVTGDLTGARGDLTGVWGDIDACGLTDADRANGVHVSELINE